MAQPWRSARCPAGRQASTRATAHGFWPGSSSLASPSLAPAQPVGLIVGLTLRDEILADTTGHQWLAGRMRSRRASQA